MIKFGNFALARKSALMCLGVLLAGCNGESGVATIDPTAATIDSIAVQSDKETVLVVAHRSCWREAPANSLEAMDRCIALGADMLEIDVRMTADNQLVVIHDDTVDRTTAHTGRVDDYSLEQLTSFRLKEGLGGPDALLTESLMPSLSTVLSHLKGRVLINLDAKESIRTDVVAMVTEYEMNDQVIIKAVASSPEDPVLVEATYLENAAFMPIIRPYNGELSDQIDSFASMSPVAYETIYQTEAELQEACESAAAQGARCWVNTMWEDLAPGHSDEISVLDPDNHWGHLVRLGVNMFQTDRPAELIAYLENEGLR